MLVDPTKTYVFIWVPGTLGHEVHPAFQAAIDKLVPDTSQVLCVKYPALWDFDNSVPKGEAALKSMLQTVAKERVPGQKVLVAGSSQGAWVITNVFDNEPYVKNFEASSASFDYKSIADKTALFGHPGVAEGHHHGDDPTIWEVNDYKNDAVTFGWQDEDRLVVRAAVDVQHWKLWKLPVLLAMMVMHPVRAMRLMYLIACAAGLVWWSRSPHDYSQQMPLAVYWLTN